MYINVLHQHKNTAHLPYLNTFRTICKATGVGLIAWGLGSSWHAGRVGKWYPVSWPLRWACGRCSKVCITGHGRQQSAAGLDGRGIWWNLLETSCISVISVSLFIFQQMKAFRIITATLAGMTMDSPSFSGLCQPSPSSPVKPVQRQRWRRVRWRRKFAIQLLGYSTKLAQLLSGF